MGRRGQGFSGDWVAVGCDEERHPRGWWLATAAILGARPVYAWSQRILTTRGRRITLDPGTGPEGRQVAPARGPILIAKTLLRHLRALRSGYLSFDLLACPSSCFDGA